MISGIARLTRQTNFQAVAAGNIHCLALQADGTLWAWGNNSFGQLGDGTTLDRKEPVQVAGGNNWVAVASDCIATVGLKKNGTLWGWGEFLDAPLVTSSSPVQLGPGTNWTAIYPASSTFAARQQDGTYWLFGRHWPWPGDDTKLPTIQLPSPSPVKELVQLTNVVGWRDPAFGGCVLGFREDGRLWGFGHRSNGDLGVGAGADLGQPLPVGHRRDWVAVATDGGSSVGMTADGSVWAWGVRLDKPPKFSTLQKVVNWCRKKWNPKYVPSPEPVISPRPQLVMRFRLPATNQIATVQAPSP